MSGSITLGANNGGIEISGGNASSIDVTGNGGGIVLDDITNDVSGASLSSYQRAVAEGYVGAEADFYASLSLIVTAGVVPSASDDPENDIEAGSDGGAFYDDPNDSFQDLPPLP